MASGFSAQFRGFRLLAGRRITRFTTATAFRLKPEATLLGQANPRAREPRTRDRTMTVFDDLRQTLRGLARSKLATAVLLLSLALGTGANATLYSVMDALLFRPPPGVTGCVAARVGPHQPVQRRLVRPDLVSRLRVDASMPRRRSSRSPPSMIRRSTVVRLRRQLVSASASCRCRRNSSRPSAWDGGVSLLPARRRGVPPAVISDALWTAARPAGRSRSAGVERRWRRSRDRVGCAGALRRPAARAARAMSGSRSRRR